MPHHQEWDSRHPGPPQVRPCFALLFADPQSTTKFIPAFDRTSNAAHSGTIGKMMSKLLSKPAFVHQSRILVLAGLVLLPVSAARSENIAEAQKRALEQIKYLASDDLQGRGVGTEGLNVAAEFVRQQFRDAGLKVDGVADNGFQKFDVLTGSELTQPNELAIVSPDGKSFPLKFDSDFKTCSFGGSGKFDAEVVFCGYAIDSKDDNFHELNDVDLKGKVALIVRKVPQQNNPHGPFAGPHGVDENGYLRTKVSNAYAKGAAAILLVNDPHSSRESVKENEQMIEKAQKALDEARAKSQSPERIQECEQRLADAKKKATEADHDKLIAFGEGETGSERVIPILHIRQEVADRLLQGALGKKLADIEAEIDHDLKPRSTALEGWKVAGETSLKQVRVDVQNVIGVLEGEGPLADETVIIGAHYDHVGLGGTGSLAPGVKEVHNGADDNASGSVALIELARRLASREKKLPRRVVFIAFTGEELGLLGSARYVKEPLFPIEKTVAMLNMDMVGRLSEEKLVVYGTGTSPIWKDLVESTGKEQGFALTLKPEGVGPSDHASFYTARIPVLHFFTGSHGDYHRPTDDWQKINVDGMFRVTNMIEKIAVAVADLPERPKYLEVATAAPTQRGGSRPYFGSVPDFSSEVVGYAISGASPGSPAEKGGLKKGDVIIGLGGNKIGNLEDFDTALRKFGPGDEIDVEVQRGDEVVKLKVVLDKPR